MSWSNVEIAQKGIEAWNLHDTDLWLSYAAPDIEWVPAGPAAVERAVYRGHEQVASGLEAVWQTWDVFEFRENEVRDLGDSVLWLGSLRMHGAASHAELDQEFAINSILSDGKLIRVQAFSSWEDAFGAVGPEA